MPNLNCLVYDTSIVEDVKDILLDVVAKNIENDLPVKIGNIYAIVKGMGIEIDAESLGAIYDDLFGASGNDMFSTADEVDAYSGMLFARQQQEVVNAILGVSEDVNKGIGFTSPEKTIAMAIGNLFKKEFYGNVNKVVKSDMLKMQDLIKKAVILKLPKSKNANNATSINELLEDFFEMDKMGFRTLSGTMNNMETLFNEVKNQVNDYVNELVKDMTPAEADIVKQQWEKYTESYINSFYDIILTKTQQKNLLNEAMRNIQVNGQSLIDANGNIKWNELSTSGNSNDIADAVEKLFKKGFTDKAGVKISFSPIEAYRIGQYVKTLYEQKVQDIIQRNSANARLKQQSPKNLLSDFIKSLGDYGVSKDTAGALTKTKTIWDRVVSQFRSAKADDEIVRLMNQARGIATSGNSTKDLLSEYERLLDDFLRRTDASGNSVLNLSQEKIEQVKKAFKDYVMSRTLPKTATPTNLQKLYALSQLNNAVAFGESTQQAVNKIAGVSNLTQSALDEIRKLSDLAGSIIGNPNIKDVRQALSQIDRRIREIVYEHKADASIVVPILTFIEDSMSVATVSNIVNPSNVAENITTNIATLTASTASSIVEMPWSIGAKASRETLKIAAKGFISHVFGGAHENITDDTEQMRDLSTGERKRLSKDYVRRLKKGDLSAWKSIGGVMFNTINRVILNSFDTAVMEGLTIQSSLSSLYQSLVDIKGKDEADQIMNEAFKLSKQDVKDIESDIDNLISEMKSLGMNPTSKDRSLMIQQAKYGAYRNKVEGALKNEESIGAISKNMSAVAKAASSVAKQLGGKKQTLYTDWITSKIYFLSKLATGVQTAQFEKATKEEMEGDYKKAAIRKFAASFIFKNGFSRYIGGRVNFLVLGLNLTPYGAVQAYSLKRQLSDVEKNKSYATRIDTANEAEYQKYVELKQMFLQTLVRFVVANAITAGFLLSKLADDDDKEGWYDELMANLMATQSGRRLVSKVLPNNVAVLSYITAHYYDKDMISKEDKLVDYIQNAYTVTDDRNLEMFLKKFRDPAIKKTDAISNYLGSTWSGNLNQIEQWNRFVKVLESGAGGSKGAVIKDEERRKVQRLKMRGAVENFLGEGMASTIIRGFSKDEELVRNSE